MIDKRLITRWFALQLRLARGTWFIRSDKRRLNHYHVMFGLAIVSEGPELQLKGLKLLHLYLGPLILTVGVPGSGRRFVSKDLKA